MAEQDRSKKLRRLATVQHKLEKMAERDLSMTVRERRDVADAMDVSVRSLNSLEPLHMALTKQYSERFSRLAMREKHLHAVERSQEVRLAKEKTKADKMDEKARDALNEEMRVADDNSAIELLELVIALKDTSSQQG